MLNKEKFSEEQLLASNPTENVWVQANAGTGKTKVLVHRLLRILFRNALYNQSGKAGILCLTYTNAGASEMRNRILEKLQQWATLDDNELSEVLEDVVERMPVSTNDLQLARRVFFTYIDNPDMLKIKTIHSFCEEILHRFPIEAGISPAWSLVSGASQSVLLDEAFNRMIKQSFDGSDSMTNTMNAFYRIIDTKSEYFLDTLKGILLSRYRSFFQVEDLNKYREYFIENTKKTLGLNSDINIQPDTQKLKNIVDILSSDPKFTKKPAAYITKIINLTQQYIDNTIDFEKYKDAYLTKTNTIISLVSKIDLLKAEADRVYKIQQNTFNKNTFDDTVALFDLAMSFAEQYKKIKSEHNLLDFEDLILYTQKLFSKPDVMGWVLSQLDGSLSYILVDEAQDTSPQQWNILQMLAGDLFVEGNNENVRSIFVVGDTKQSIYGFQNADPVAFASSRQAISEQISENYRTIQEIPLDQNFRSVKPILDTVDCFFDCPSIIKNTGFYNNKHKCFFDKEKGFVEIHDAFTTEETGVQKKKLYVRTVSDKIEELIKDGWSSNDIMVLVQRRSSFANQLSNELKRRGIDVAGNDRIKLPEFSAIKDLLHMVRICIDQSNDYSLCCLLKSPIYRLKEADILNLCTIKNNAKKSGKELKIFDILSEIHPAIYNDLSDIIEHSKTLAPYSFFTYILHKNDTYGKFVSALGKQVIDPIEEFMTMCLAYERTQSGTLYHFLKWFITSDSEIKRDMDASQGVRIMTVHGSKGLASPIVFLIDTFSFPKQGQILDTNYLHNNSHYDTWIWKTSQSDLIQSVIDKNTNDAVAEYYRLLYVAMTRARKQLYVYGCDTERVSDMVWHKQLWNVFSNAKDLFVDEHTIRITNDTNLNQLFEWCKK